MGAQGDAPRLVTTVLVSWQLMLMSGTQRAVKGPGLFKFRLPVHNMPYVLSTVLISVVK